MFLAKPSLLGVMDAYGVKLIHPVRNGRNPEQWEELDILNHSCVGGGCVSCHQSLGPDYRLGLDIRERPRHLAPPED